MNIGTLGIQAPILAANFEKGTSAYYSDFTVSSCPHTQ